MYIEHVSVCMWWRGMFMGWGLYVTGSRADPARGVMRGLNSAPSTSSRTGGGRDLITPIEAGPPVPASTTWH